MARKKSKKKEEEIEVEAEVLIPTEEKKEKKMARASRLKKDLTEIGVLKIEIVNGETLIFNPSDLPTEIQKLLPTVALSHRLGDAVAGIAEPELIKANLEKVWQGMLEGNWKIRKPGTPKVELSAIKDNLSNLTNAEQEAAKTLLASLGITI